ncbi:MAG: 3'-5' exonuclease [Oscillospiraceae bacterium]|nr:3'-5' exonuclease [Oscillospiraceae bacterium]
MNRFIVFDVETPNHWNNRMSAIGITVIEDGIITDNFYSLVDPEQPFDWFNIKLTGINEESVFDAPAFPQLWEKIEPIMSSGILVAHNASFDMNVLRSCLSAYEIEWKPFVRGICTVVMGRSLLPGISHKLNDMCDYYGICLNHHQADSDSRACAEILLRYLETGADPEKYIRTYRLI